MWLLCPPQYFCVLLVWGWFLSLSFYLNTTAYTDILVWLLLRGNSLEKVLSGFNLTMCKARSIKKWFLCLVWKNLTGLHRALILTPPNTLGTSLITTPAPNFTNAFVAEWEQILAARFQVWGCPHTFDHIVYFPGKGNAFKSLHNIQVTWCIGNKMFFPRFYTPGSRGLSALLKDSFPGHTLLTDMFPDRVLNLWQNFLHSWTNFKSNPD